MTFFPYAKIVCILSGVNPTYFEWQHDHLNKDRLDSNDLILHLNFHSINILPVFSKIFERAFYNRFYKLSERANLLYDKQFGVCMHRITVDALAEITEDKSEIKLDYKSHLTHLKHLTQSLVSFCCKNC